jgi:hypothetical protein
VSVEVTDVGEPAGTGDGAVTWIVGCAWETAKKSHDDAGA